MVPRSMPWIMSIDRRRGLAARAGFDEMVSWLLERGADVNKAGTPWASPLAWARKRGHEAIAEKLTAARAL